MNSRFPFLLALALLFTCDLHSHIKLVGTHYDSNSGITSVVRWDVSTGAVLDSVPTTQQGTVMGSSVFDAYNGRYYFNGPQNMVRIGFTPSSYEVLGHMGDGFRNRN